MLVAAALLVFFAALVVAAAAHDVASMTIPDWISIALTIVFPIAGLVSGMAPLAIGAHLLTGALVLLAGFVLFHLRVMGGGDAKLFAAVAVWTGGQALWPFLLATFLAGGALAAAILAARAFLKPAPHRPAFLNRLLSRENGAPYGVAICAGAISAAPVTPIIGAAAVAALTLL